ncbi:MAG: ABC transporter permease [Thiofilum sp.]|uniref:ABC transporter permease n=1 Tax=Thiofilum sp. TaxID=2212733 RepID=UPI0025DE637F|nr:ABC transporter permease [Thiofilum sp.]MBK8455153.1 ABC transporter permease [Thiofilum sp.]
MIKLQPRREPSTLMVYLSPVLAGLLTLITGAILFVALGYNPLTALHTFLIAPLADSHGVSEWLVKASPILMCAIGLAVAYRANIWNIGAEGQLLMGALVGSAVALQFPESESKWTLVLVIICGALAGMFWAGIAAFLKTQFNTNEILTTIMLNYIALNLLQYAVHGPLKDPDGYSFPESAPFSAGATLPTLMDDGRVHIGFGLALIAVLLIWFLVRKSFLGFQMKVMGMEAKAAKFAGYPEKRLTWLVLLISGGLAGLAGVSEVTGPIGQLIPNVSPWYGYAAIIVAFLGRLHPMGILAASLLMALIYLGGELAQIKLGTPAALTLLFQGMLLFYLLACDVLIRYRLTTTISINFARGAN